MLAGLTGRFLVTVANCYTGRWRELDVDPGNRKAQNARSQLAWHLGTLALTPERVE